MNYQDLITKAFLEASLSAQDYLDKHYSGKDWGPCGFAWVEITPEHKGNTKEGKAERNILRGMGFELDYTGKRFMYWNPSKHPAQNVDCKYVGAVAFSRVLQEAGFKAYACSRLD